MALHYLNHGVFDLPEIGFKDETIHFFRKKLSDEEEAGLMVVHTALPPDQTFEASVARHVQEQSKRLMGHAILDARDTVVAGLRAVDVSTRWFHDKKSFYERQVHLLIDGGWMFFAMSSPLLQRAACDEVMDHILATFQPRV